MTLEMIRERWPSVLEAVRQNSKAIEALLKDSVPTEVENGDQIVLQFPYRFHASRAQEGPNLVIIQRAFSRTLGVRVTVRCEVVEGAGSKGDRGSRTVGTDDPVVAKALRMWNARILTPDELAALDAMPIAPGFESSDATD